MQQVELIVGPWESFLEALRDDVGALGGPKAVGEWFQAEKSIEARRNYVNDRLNCERRERFSEEQLELIMQRAVKARGYSAAHYYLCDRLGTERPKIKDPESERDRAMAAFVQGARQMERVVEELKRLGVQMPFRSVG